MPQVFGNECVPIIRSSIALAVVGASADAPKYSKLIGQKLRL